MHFSFCLSGRTFYFLFSFGKYFFLGRGFWIYRFFFKKVASHHFQMLFHYLLAYLISDEKSAASDRELDSLEFSDLELRFDVQVSSTIRKAEHS